jgi:hypothetical protein
MEIEKRCLEHANHGRNHFSWQENSKPPSDWLWIAGWQ